MKGLFTKFMAGAIHLLRHTMLQSLGVLRLLWKKNNSNIVFRIIETGKKDQFILLNLSGW